ncbi:MAG: hypothetical protein QP798_00285 [Staphylococcus simulans]|uniref:hypothetical protein n=1 Tax=Staphylococcus simulans TaxID=1286 RepID=UPI0025556652|nr:hypothetical protein [Staphylococcus simulans]MDK7925714.1 hypothetical protein [Staphylococcus simulans]MDK8314371.1 hypothetical protein [Staphylococcus simulans]
MNKLLVILSVVLVLGIIGAVGFFGYNKYQEVELEKKKLEAQLKQGEENDESEAESNNTENIGQSDESTSNQQETQVTDGSETVKNSGGSGSGTANKEEFSDLQVNRDNVFDYLIAAINQSEGGDASKIKFQQPELIMQDGGMWKIPANNKSGHGSYTFIVNQNGTVEFWDGMMNDKFDEIHVTLP